MPDLPNGALVGSGMEVEGTKGRKKSESTGPRHMPRLRELLRDPKNYDLPYALFADKARANSDSDCLVLDPDDVESIDDVPEQAREAGCDYVLMMDDIVAIVSNLLVQANLPSDELRLDALRFYLARDAFIVVSNCPGFAGYSVT